MHKPDNISLKMRSSDLGSINFHEKNNYLYSNNLHGNNIEKCSNCDEIFSHLNNISSNSHLLLSNVSVTSTPSNVRKSSISKSADLMNEDSTKINMNFAYYDSASRMNSFYHKSQTLLIEKIKKHEARRHTLHENYLKLTKNYISVESPQLDDELYETFVEHINSMKLKYCTHVYLPKDVDIRERDLKTLFDLNWLNDTIISRYLNMIMARSNSSSKYSPVHAFNTFFYPKLTRSGYDSVKKWVRGNNLFEMDLVLFPIHVQNVHWCLCIADMKSQTIKYYDSLGCDNYDCIETIKYYLNSEHISKTSCPLNFSSWYFDCPKNIPKQKNGSDCGVFLCIYAEYASRRSEFSFTQSHMPYFRKRILYEILTNKLLL